MTDKSDKKALSDEQLLKIAMGAAPEDTDSEEGQFLEIARLRSEWEVLPERGKDILTKRKRMRHNLFKIVKAFKLDRELTPELQAIHDIIDPQLHENHFMEWEHFTFHWDLNPRDHRKIVTKANWFAEGGRYDELGSLMPTAFTEQEI